MTTQARNTVEARNLGHGWTAHIKVDSDGIETMTIRHDNGDIIDLPEHSVSRLRAIIRESEKR